MIDFFKKLLGGGKKITKTDIDSRFNKVGRVGQGTMSKVWKAIDYTTGRTVALKVLDKEKTEKLEARFKGLDRPSEGEIAMQLKHPNVVRTLEHGWTRDAEQFLVMEYIEGSGLSFHVLNQSKLLQKKRLEFAIQLGQAIEYFHRENWIHRDICPRNVMVDENNVVKLIDFGLVVPNTPDFRKPGNRTGTAQYMAPELVKRQPTDQRIDVYSFGITTYEMFTKNFPWKLKSSSFEAVVQAINSPPTPIQEHCPKIDGELAEVLMKAIAARPDDRWSSMTRLLEALRTVHARTPTGLATTKQRS